MIKKLLVMCSTRRRSLYLSKMLASFIKTRTKELTKLIVYISEKDSQLEEYKNIIPDFPEIQFIIDKERNMVEILNYLSVELYPEFEYYAEINDDHIYITEGWDKKLINAIEEKGGWGIACGNDKIPDWELDKHPSGFVMSGNIVRTLGYFTYPKFKHFGCDEYHRDIGLATNLIRLSEVIIEHRCYHTANKMPADENTDEIYSSESMNYGNQTYAEWKGTNDIQKLNSAQGKCK